MADTEQDLLDYEEEEDQTTGGIVDGATTTGVEAKKGGYVSIHSSGFRDFLLKPELLRAIIDCGFEHPRFDTILIILDSDHFVFNSILVHFNN